MLDDAKEMGALTYALDNYQTARDLIAQARAALAQENYDEGQSLATERKIMQTKRRSQLLPDKVLPPVNHRQQNWKLTQAQR